MSLTEDVPNAREQLLDEVLANYLKAVQQGQAPSRQALLNDYPQLASDLAEFFADQDRVERLAAPLRAVAQAQPLASGTVLGDYELLEEIAQGGMGIVYRARQKSLQRLVAVKVLLAGPLASPEQARRFQAEAEAIAGLDHANIVPIYEVGTFDHRPYFSMKLLEGGSLADRLARGDRPAPREAATLLATVADAVHYAHERGILHRDLKPANVLLDTQGRPHVSDFGLAKRAVESAGGTGVSPVQASRISAASIQKMPSHATPPPAAALTVSGAIVGTPSYMAPEQAAGSRTVTTAADVYGLGAILYEMLTGRPPVRGADLFDTLRRIQDEQPAAPRSINASVERNLDIICLKCLQKEPSRRYGSAREVALDLRRYLAGEPIEARAAGPLERLWLWCRRKPVAAAVTLAFAAVVATAFVLIEGKRREAVASAAALAVANHDLEASRELVERKRREAVQSAAATAEANRNLAASRDRGRRIIDDFCLQLSEDGWSDDPVQQKRRMRLLERGLNYYRHFLDNPNDDMPARGELVRTYYRIGDITFALGKPNEARDAFHRALVVAQTLLQIEPADRGVRYDLARIYNRLGQLESKAGRKTDALPFHHKARDLLIVLRREQPDELNAVGELGVACNSLGLLYGDLRRFDEAAAAYHECIDINRDLIRRTTDLQHTYALSVSLQNYGLMLYRKGQRAAAWNCFRESEKLSRRVVDAEPNVPRYQQQMGRILHNVGYKLCVEKRYAEAIRNLQEGRVILEHLVKMQPRIWWYKEDLARSLDQLGRAHRDLSETPNHAEDADKAIQHFLAAGELCKEFSPLHPNAADLQHRQASCFFNAALLEAKHGKRKEAIRSYEQTRDVCRELLKGCPDRLDTRHMLGVALNNLGRQLWELKRRDAALAALNEALPHNRWVLERSPANRHYRTILNTTYVNFGDVYRDSGRLKDWAAVLLDRRRLWDDNATELSKIAGDLARARAEDDAMRTLEQAVARGFKDFAQLEKDPSLTGLCQRPDFAKLKQRTRPPN